MGLKTLSQSEYNDLVGKAIKMQPISKTIPLGSLEIVDRDTVKIGGRTIRMGHNAFRGLAKILGIPVNFHSRIGEYFGEGAAGMLANKMKSALARDGLKTITVIANPVSKEIIGFSKKEGSYIPNSLFFKLIENIIGDNNLEVRDFSISHDGEVIINCLNPKSEFLIKGLPNECFNGGLAISNRLNSGIRVSPYINRLQCSNGLIGESFSESYRIKNLMPDKIEEFYRHIEGIKKREYRPRSFEERIHAAVRTKASYAEMEAAADLIISNSGAKEDEISQWIPFAETKKEYIKAGINPSLMNKRQKMNARTGITIWDMVNGLTHFSTHRSAFNVSDWARREMQIGAGSIIAKRFDMEDQVISPFK